MPKTPDNSIAETNNRSRFSSEFLAPNGDRYQILLLTRINIPGGYNIRLIHRRHIEYSYFFEASDDKEAKNIGINLLKQRIQERIDEMTAIINALTSCSDDHDQNTTESDVEKPPRQDFDCTGCEEDHHAQGMLGPHCLQCYRQYPGQEAADYKADYYRPAKNQERS